MSLLQRISRVVRANISFMVDKAEDPTKQLDCVFDELTDLKVQQSHAVAEAIASQNQLQQKYNQALNNAEQFKTLAKQAVLKGRDDLATTALAKRNEHQSTAQSLLAAIESQQVQINELKNQLQQVDTQIQEARTKKDILKAKHATAKAQDALNKTAGGAMAAFAKMEEKIELAAAKSQAMLEMDSEYSDRQIIQQLNTSNVNDELMALKAQVSTQQTLSLSPNQSLSLDEELRLLQQQLLPRSQSTDYQGRVIVRQTIERTL